MVRMVYSLLVGALVLAAHPWAQTPAAPAPAAAAAPKAALVNLNTATSTELQTLPGIGERTAERIIEYRKLKGPFKKIEELMNVQGIGEKSFLKLRAQITVSAKPDGAGSPQQ